MKLSNFFKRRLSSPSGEDLRATLISAVQRQDWQVLARLCEQNQQAIRDSFPTWQRVPEEIRNDPMARDRYCEGLMGVALLFERAGDQSLIALMTGDETNNPAPGWERDLSAAQSLIDNGKAGQAAELLQTALARAQELSGPGVNHYLARTFGMLGVALYKTGDTPKAVDLTTKARVMCEQLGDEEGVRAYAGNLQHMAEGPPEIPKMVFRDEEGRELSENELANFTGRVRWEIVGSEPVPSKAKELHSLARREGEAGNYAKALELLQQACKEARHWPYPVYDAAYTFLLMGDSDNALQNYEAVVRMAPRGFFTSITAVHYLRRERSGELDPGTYKDYLMLELVSDVVQKRTILEGMVKRAPTFAPAWMALAVLLEDEAARLEAIEAGLFHEPDQETKGVLLLNKALILNRQGKRQEAIRIVGELAIDPKAPLSVEHRAKLTLKLVEREK